MILVLITAYGTDALEEEAHRLGIGYVTKPFGLPQLVQIIHDLLRGKETRDKTENAPRILFADPKSNADLGSRMGRVSTDPGIVNL